MSQYSRVVSRLLKNPGEIIFRLFQFLWNRKSRFFPPTLEALSNVELAPNFRAHFFAPPEEQETISSIISGKFQTYAEDICKEADEILQGKYTLLGFTGLSFGQPDHVDFHTDPVHASQLPLDWWQRILKNLGSSSVDPKIIWEFNRHQYLVLLGIAYRLSGDKKYKTYAQNHISLWIAQNPPFYGINWTSSLELAFRVISWMWACQLFHFDDSWEDYQNFLKTLILHGRFIEHNLSTYHSPNTHITGEALGLFYLGLAFSHTKRGEKWITKGKDILLHFIDVHVLEDGGYIERSFWYHRYTVDIFQHYYLLSKQYSHAVPTKVAVSLQETTRYLYETMTPDCKFPRFGDDDGGKLLRLDSGPVTDCLREIFCCHAILFDQPEYIHKIVEFKPSILFLAGVTAHNDFKNLSNKSSLVNTNIDIGSTGFHVMRGDEKNEEVYLVFDTGPLGWLNCGHGHADTLSFIVEKGSQKVVVDPGTYTYKGEARNVYRGERVHSTLSVDGVYPAIPAQQPFHWQQTTKSLFLGRRKFDNVEVVAGRLIFSDGTVQYHDREIYQVFPDIFVIRDKIIGEGKHRISRRLPLAGVDWQIINGSRCVSVEKAVSIECVKEDDLKIFLNPLNTSEIYGAEEPATMMVIETDAEIPIELYMVINLSALETRYELVQERDGGRFAVYDDITGEKRELPTELTWSPSV